MKITTSVEITPERICDVLVGAFEGGSTYWAREANLLEGCEDPKATVVWWGQPQVYADHFQIELRYDDPDLDEGNGAATFLMTENEVERGLQVMATKYPHHFAEILNEEDDAGVDDVALQCIVFADREEPIVYG